MLKELKYRVIDLIHSIRRKRYYRGKKYGVIRRNSPECGLFSFFMVFIGGINKCIEEGLIPVVDMQTYKNQYLENEQVGEVNAWEFYFLQPMEIGLHQINNMSEIAIIDANVDFTEEERPNLYMKFLTDPDKIQYWRHICAEYIRFNPETQAFLDDKKRVLLDQHEGGKLGILCRGTDYLSLKPAGHPIQPAIDTVIEKARLLMKEKECKYVFLATEDMDILQKFQREFGSQLIVNESERFSNIEEGKYLHEMAEQRKLNKYDSGLNYLTTIYLLSQCDYLIAGRTSGLIGALLMGKPYEYQYFWDLGCY